MYTAPTGRLSQDEPNRTHVLVDKRATDMSGGTQPRYVRLGEPTTPDLSEASRFTREHAEMFAGTNPDLEPRPAEESTVSPNTAPVLDANNVPVNVPADVEVTDGLREFMAGRVPAACGHYIAASEAAAGFQTCERC